MKYNKGRLVRLVGPVGHVRPVGLVGLVGPVGLVRPVRHVGDVGLVRMVGLKEGGIGYVFSYEGDDEKDSEY